jgi:hypothetical protein
MTGRVQQRLIVVRGIEDERDRLAGLLADAIAGPVARVPMSDLGRRWIRRGLGDQAREVDAVYRLFKLAAVGFLKDGFSVVADAPFAALIDGAWDLRTQDARDLMRLARTFRNIHAGAVTLRPSGAVPPALARAEEEDTIEDEVVVVQNLLADEGSAVRQILARLGM